MVRRQGEEKDPFDDIDLAVDTTEISCLIYKLIVVQYLNIWLVMMIFQFVRNLIMNIVKKNFYHHLHPSSEPVSADSGNEDDYDVEELPVFKVRNMSEAILNLEDVSKFLDSRGHCKEATVIASALDMITGLHSQTKMRQSSIDEFMTTI